MFMNAPFRRKDSEIETEPCYVETAITLSQYDFNYFKTHLLEDQEFIKNNIDKMGYSQDGTRHCILVLSEGSNDGVLVDSQGSNYARYIAFMPNAKKLYNLDRYLDLSNYVDDMTKFADFCADRILQGQDDGRFVLSLSSMKHEYGLHSLDAELLVNMLRNVQIDPSLPVEEKMKSFIKQIKNPYRYRVGDIVVNIRFTDNARPFKDALAAAIKFENR